MALTPREIHLVTLAAMVAAGCRGCIQPRVQWLNDPQSALHAAAIGAWARNVDGAPMPPDYVHGICYRAVLTEREVLLTTIGADAALARGAAVFGHSDETAAAALGARAPIRAASDLALQMSPPLAMTNEANRKAFPGPLPSDPGRP